MILSAINWNEILSAISAIGFPIVACLGIAVFMREEIKAQREDLRKSNEQHLTEMMAFKDALDNNTLALTKLCEKIEGDE